MVKILIFDSFQLDSQNLMHQLKCESVLVFYCLISLQSETADYWEIQFMFVKINIELNYWLWSRNSFPLYYPTRDLQGNYAKIALAFFVIIMKLQLIIYKYIP